VHCVVSWPRTLERVEIDCPNNAMTPNLSWHLTAASPRRSRRAVGECGRPRLFQSPGVPGGGR